MCVSALGFTWEGTFLGGSILMVGSHSPGGSTVTWSKNSSIPATRSLRSFALYATSWNTLDKVKQCLVKKPKKQEQDGEMLWDSADLICH